VRVVGEGEGSGLREASRKKPQGNGRVGGSVGGPTGRKGRGQGEGVMVLNRREGGGKQAGRLQASEEGGGGRSRLGEGREIRARVGEEYRNAISGDGRRPKERRKRIGGIEEGG